MEPISTTNAGQYLDRLLREPEVKRLTGLSRSQRHRMVRAGKFPAPVRISERASAWRESAIATWLASLAPADASMEVRQ